MSSFELRALLKRLMLEAGFAKDSQSWVWRSSELVWLVNLDRSPYRDSFSLVIGIFPFALDVDSAPVKANDCPIMIHLQNLPLTPPRELWDARLDDFGSIVITSLDLDTAMDDEKREKLLTSIIAELGSYVRRTATIGDLRARHEAGDFRSAFIRKDVKHLI